ncbi:hypothetical protein Tco_0189452 [Tanacetum coccineum]
MTLEISHSFPPEIIREILCILLEVLFHKYANNALLLENPLQRTRRPKALRSTRNTDRFRVNLWHDGIFLVNPFTNSSGDFRVINDVNFEGMTYSDFFAIIRRLVLVSPVKMFYKTPGLPLTSLKELTTDDDDVAFVKDGYDHGNGVELYTEHSSYNVLEMINNELNEDASIHKSSSDLDSSDDDYDPLDDLTDLKKDDPDEHLVDQKFKVQKYGISYPSFDPDTPWDQCTPMLGMKFETSLQLKNCLANYGVKNGYQLWYMQNDSSKLLVKCGRNVSKGKCAGMKGKKSNPKPSIEEPKVRETSKQGEKGVCSEKPDK